MRYNELNYSYPKQFSRQEVERREARGEQGEKTSHRHSSPLIQPRGSRSLPLPFFGGLFFIYFEYDADQTMISMECFIARKLKSNPQNQKVTFTDYFVLIRDTTLQEVSSNTCRTSRIDEVAQWINQLNQWGLEICSMDRDMHLNEYRRRSRQWYRHFSRGAFQNTTSFV